MSTLGVIASFLALTSIGQAGPFTPKSSQGSWVQKQVERPLVLPKGWLSVGVAVDTKRSSQYRGADGQLRAQAKGVVWQYTRLWFELEQGSLEEDDVDEADCEEEEAEEDERS